MEQAQVKRPGICGKLTLRLRDGKTAAKQSEIDRLNAIAAVEVMAKRKKGMVLRHPVVVNPIPCRTRGLRSNAVKVPKNSPYTLVRLNGTLTRVKCIRTEVAHRSPPVPPPLPLIRILKINPQEKPPIQKVTMVRFLEDQSRMPSSSTSLMMRQHDYARPSTSRALMGNAANEDNATSNNKVEARNWREEATYEQRKRLRMEFENPAAPLPQYRIVPTPTPTLNLRPIIARRARETVIQEAVSSSSDGRCTSMQLRSRQIVLNRIKDDENDPVSSSTGNAEGSKLHANYTRSKRVLKYIPMVDDSDDDDSD